MHLLDKEDIAQIEVTLYKSYSIDNITSKCN